MPRRRVRRLIPAALVLAFLTFPLTAYAVTVVTISGGSATIAANTSWGPTGSGAATTADVFWVRSQVTVNSGFTLTLLPGTLVKFDPGLGMVVNGQLQAVGTSLNQISFTSSRDDTRGGDTNGDGGSTVAAASDWYGIACTSLVPDSTRLTFCDIGYGGNGNHGAVIFTNTSGRLTNCAIHQSYCGVECQGTSTPLLVDTNIQNSTITPVMMDMNATPTFQNVTFSQGNNGWDAIGLKTATLASGTATLTKRAATVGITPYSNLTYVMLGSLTINSGASFVVSHGIVIKPLAGQYINVFGNLSLSGTVSDSVVVTSISDDNFGQPTDTNHNGSSTSPAVSDWNGIYFNPGATGTLTYCHLSFGNNNNSYGMVDITGCSPSISNSLLFVAAHGITMHGAQSPSITNVAIDNCTSAPILQSLAATPTYTSLTFLGNTITALGIIGEAVTGTPHLTQQTVGGYANITYYVMNTFIDIQPGATFTIDPGVVIKFQNGGTGIIVEGAMVAQGSAGNQIVFTSERDDNFGNPKDTNGDANSTQPASNNWGYIRYLATSNYVTSKFGYCRLLYGSGSIYDGYPANLWLDSPTFSVANSFISGGGFGVRVDGATSPTFASDSIVANAYAPIVMSPTIDPTFTSDVLTRNGVNGLGLLPETITTNARLRYRPTVAFSAPDAPAVLAYVIWSTITIPAGLTLSVEPQVVIKPVSNFQIFAVNGALNMVGSDTGAGRIVFTSYHDDAYGGDTNNNFSGSSAAIGQWGYLQLNDTSVDSQCIIRDCLFQFGGGGGNSNGVITTVSASPKLARLDFFANITAFTFYGPSTPSLDTVSVQGCTQLPIVQSLQADPSFAHMTFANDTYTALGLIGETVTANVRTPVRTLGPGILNNIAYMPTGTISIATGATWTIMPGICIKLGRVYYDPAGITINIDGKLVANGKPDSLIVFTSSADDAFGGDTFGDGAASSPGVGQWDGITFSALSKGGGSSMSYCLLRYGGFNGDNVIRCVNSDPAISNCTFTFNWNGISSESAASPTFVSCSFDSTYYLPVRMSLVSNPTFTNISFQKNNYTGIGVINETIAQDLLWKIRPMAGRQNMPYIIDGTVGVGLGSTMTLQPGLILKFRPGGGLDVQRALYAQGGTVPESLIVFTSSRDDFYGGRSDTTSATNAPAPGDWNYITIEGTAIDANVRFHNCVIRYGGSGFTGALRAVNSSPAIDSCVFAYNNTGISVEGASNPTVNGCSIYGNYYYGIYNSGTSFCVNAQHNWWGAANGPNDPSSVADICLLGSNAGSGDQVSNNVDYTNYVNTANGLLNPLLGDVSLNGRVLAYDASLVLQYTVSLIALNPLQKLVADVSGTSGITAFDASLILQYVAGVIRAFPAISNHARPALPAEAAGPFTVTLGDARRDATGWAVPVSVSGGSAWSLELGLTGGSAASLASVEPSDAAAMPAMNAAGGIARVAIAAVSALPGGVVATLHFPASDAFQAPTLVSARVNESDVDLTPPSVAVSRAFFALAGANPARDAAEFSLGLSSHEAGAPTRVVVYDLSGRQVRVVQDGVLPAGLHVLKWDLTDSRGRSAPAGVYLVRANCGRFTAGARLVVVR